MKRRRLLSHSLFLILFFWLTVDPGAFVAANEPVERITLNLDRVELNRTLDDLIHQYQFSIVYQDKQVQGFRVSVHCSNWSIEKVLDQLLDKTPLVWKKIGQHYLVLLSDGVEQKLNKFTIGGFVSDLENGENLIYANVIDKNSHRGTITNAHGFYSLTLPEGIINLQISYVSYESKTIIFTLRRDTTLNVELNPSVIRLDSIAITVEREDLIQNSAYMSQIDIPIRQMRSMPALLGETDPLKVLQIVPGVQSGMEGNSGLVVRGSSPDQNLILLDGVPVYNAYHMFGFLSLFNADALKNVQLIKGGFPARFGGRLASVIDIHMKEGNLKTFKGETSLGLVMSKLQLEGPIKKNRSSYFVSFRRTYIDLILKPFLSDDEKMSYYAFDFNGKVNYRFSNKDRLFFSGYFGDDKLQESTRQNYPDNTFITKSESDWFLQWGNQTGALRWNHLFNQKLFSNLAATSSCYTIHLRAKERKDLIEDGIQKIKKSDIALVSMIQDWAGKLDLDWIPNPDHYIRFGTGWSFHTFNPGSFRVRINGGVDTTFDNQLYRASEGIAYIEDDVQIGSRLKMNLGARYSFFRVTNRTYQAIEPRCSLRYLLSTDLSVKSSYAETIQYIHMLAPPGFDLPLDFWVPSTDQIQPEKARQIALGFGYLWKSNFEISLEGYYKTMKNVINYQEGAVLLDTKTNWDQKSVIGVGSGYGLELFVHRKVGKIKGWLGYTFSRADRRFDGLNHGKSFPFRYDRRHNINIALIFDDLLENKEFSINWVFGSGKPTTIPMASHYNPDYDLSYIYTQRNGYRMSPYHRLDVGMTIKKSRKSREHKWTFSIYNVYNRLNPFYIYYQPESNRFKQRSVFPIIPSISYSTTF